uniref:Uncharacterized protein n=1 Tax=viral metagenome TaxID=1070528 RepID=A0A6C0BS66_9ZZZZ
MNETVENFFRLSIHYEKKIRRSLVNEIIAKIRPHVNDEAELKNLRKLIHKYMNKRNRRVVSISESKRAESFLNENENIYDTPKKKTVKKEIVKEEIVKEIKKNDTNLINMKKYILKELKYNMSPVTTSLTERFSIAQEVLKLMRKSNITLTSAKCIVYTKYNIFITHPVEFDTSKTDENNMHEEREYDEIRGCIVYGWNDDGDVLYEPTFNANITPPTYKQSCHQWREVLENRWEQRSYCDPEEELDTYIGN